MALWNDTHRISPNTLSRTIRTLSRILQCYLHIQTWNAVITSLSRRKIPHASMRAELFGTEHTLQPGLWSRLWLIHPIKNGSMEYSESNLSPSEVHISLILVLWYVDSSHARVPGLPSPSKLAQTKRWCIRTSIYHKNEHTAILLCMSFTGGILNQRWLRSMLYCSLWGRVMRMVNDIDTWEEWDAEDQDLFS